MDIADGRQFRAGHTARGSPLAFHSADVSLRRALKLKTSFLFPRTEITQAFEDRLPESRRSVT
jgi:hypothetical protein